MKSYCESDGFSKKRPPTGFRAGSLRAAERQLAGFDACAPSEVWLLGGVGEGVLLGTYRAPGAFRETLRSAATGHCDQGTQTVCGLCQLFRVTGLNAC